MSITSLYFPRSLRRPFVYARRDHARREQAIECFEAGDPVAAANASLAHLLLPGTLVPDLAREPLCIVQGTARVRLRLEGDRLVASAAIARLTDDSNAVAVLRYFLTEVAGTGQLHQPRLRNDVITLEFDERLALLHPLKLVETVKKLADEACKNDVWLEQRFDVAMHDREPPEPLSDDELDRACAIWDAHWKATAEMLDELHRRRSTDLLNRVGAYARNQIEDLLPLHGDLYEMLNDAEKAYADRDEAPGKRLAALAKCVREAEAHPKDDLRRSLGHARYMINPLDEGSPSMLSKVLAGSHREQMIGDLNAAGRVFESALFQAADVQYLLAYYAWPPAVEQALRDALHGISGRPLREAAETLRVQAAALIRSHGGSVEEDDEESIAEDASAAHGDLR